MAHRPFQGSRKRKLVSVPGYITNSYSYDAGSRLSSVTDGKYSAAYTYIANSSLVGQILFKEDSNTRMTTAKAYDFLNRLQSIASSPAASAHLPFAYGYKYNKADQRTRMTAADESYWIYTYDNLGQVISGKRYWVDGTPVAGQQYEYAFDDIGNRTSTKSGGNDQGLGLRSTSYTRTLINTYSARVNPNEIDILGIADPAATATVNASSTYRKGEYFHKALTVNNSGSAIWQAIAVEAVKDASTTTQNGYIRVPKASESFSYDADGNLTSDSIWSYSWDGENRLKEMNGTAHNGASLKLVFDYDYMGRRIQKAVVQGGSTNLYLRFVYDSWNLLAELNATNNHVVRSYLWGKDLSGSLQGAGGVGGLLALKDSSGTAHFAAYDGNGNVVGLVTGTSGTATAQYEYDPFGEVIRATGPMAKVNPFRFSSKYEDEESGFLYYGHRYYSASTGRWLNPDPVHDLAFKISLMRAGQWKESGLAKEFERYLFVGNDPLNRIDLLGLDSVQMVATTVIRPPDAEQGVKTKHVVVVNEYGRITSFTHFIGYTDLIIGAPTGGGALTESVSGSHPNFTVTLTGIAWSAALGPSFSIDYTFTFDLNFCSRTGVFNGNHDTYPSYTAQAAGQVLYDFKQKGSAFLGLPGIGGVTAGPVNFSFK
jgi:RHS repeat-associated protein